MASVIIRELTWEKGFIYAGNVRNLLLIALTSIMIRIFTLYKGLMSTVNMGNFFSIDLSSLLFREFTGDRPYADIKCGKSFTL